MNHNLFLMKSNSSHTWKSMSILIVDDDPDEQEFLVSAFHDIAPQYRITCLADGKRSVLHLQSLREEDLPSLIVLDYNMPGWTGADVLYSLKHTEKLMNIPVIIYSNAPFAPYGQTLNGAKALVQKASTIQGIRENVRTFLGFRQS
jgi:CheY-like chemotaxis protein